MRFLDGISTRTRDVNGEFCLAFMLLILLLLLYRIRNTRDMRRMRKHKSTKYPARVSRDVLYDGLFSMFKYYRVKYASSYVWMSRRRRISKTIIHNIIRDNILESFQFRFYFFVIFTRRVVGTSTFEYRFKFQINEKKQNVLCSKHFKRSAKIICY